ncbi:tektin-1-like [Hydractinia symbiolongicarpus]|uniref:tektin-1-like n=1 Tax=Hydractinia symbiolongicarpus TaxID=13093 RepID=UPI00254B7DE9|nr:tektin-1-like [Hydractinia symbiolongicarpus]
MAKLIEAPTKYTSQEWHLSNDLNYKKAEQDRKVSEMIRDESVRLANETHITTMKTQSDVNKKLEQRLNDINFWKSELDRQYQETEDEIKNMLEYKKRLEGALEATQIPLHIAKECLRNREKRIGIDLVHDDVEVQLLKEVEVIEGVQALLKRTLEQATEQIRLLRSANYYLGKDITDKFYALKIDDRCSSLKNTSPDKYYAPNSVKIQANSVTPEEWEQFSNKNVLKGEQERNSSVTLRSMIDEILQESFDDQSKQCDNVNLALAKRVEETEKAKRKLEDHLEKVKGEIDDMEKNIDLLRQAIAEKEPPMQVAQTRLDTRTHRPNVELCRDRVQYKLVNEVGQISHNVDRLREMLQESEASLKGLIRQQLNLEEEIEVKINSLMIDRDQNTFLRQQINHKQH